jgi:hypothetical protein
MENFSHASFAKQDNDGNILYVRFTLVNGEKRTAQVVLKLAGHTRYRNIGLITMKDNTLHVKRSIKNHYHYKAGGYGFNWEMLSEKMLFQIDKIHMVVTDEDIVNRHYLFPKSVIDEHGKFMYFKQQSFELQRFINMTFIEPFAVNNISEQSNLVY